MALNPHYAGATRNTMLNVINTDVGASPVFQIYAGVQPADVSSAVTAANAILASLEMAATAFGAAAGGVLTAATLTSEATAVAGTAAWFSIVKATGARVVDGSVGTATCDLILNSVTITTGATVAVSACTITMAA
jgi:hypothetical protein